MGKEDKKLVPGSEMTEHSPIFKISTEPALWQTPVTPIHVVSVTWEGHNAAQTIPHLSLPE